MNSHAYAIRTIEGQLSLLAAQLEPRVPIKHEGRHFVVVTRSGKTTITNALGNEEN